MSEAEKTPEVEDVLSSIRRLVADGPRVVHERPQPLVANAQAPEPIQEPQIDALQSPLEVSDEPVSFVDAINASIAEISEESEETSNVEAETRAAHVNAFLANETEKPSEIAEPDENLMQKSEPFVLRADMAAEIEQHAEPEVAEEPQLPEEVVLTEHDNTQAEYEAAAQDFPEDTDAFPKFEDIADAEIEQEIALDTNSNTDAQFIDEDALRDIVSELVRAELQGDLGDRITRNVRKLVRREIHHALATRDFE